VGRRGLAFAASMALALGLAGCTGESSVSCAPVANGVGVCLDGKPFTWTATKPPHMHEQGGYYAPVEELAARLGVQAEIASDRKSVMVGSTQVIAKGEKPQGIHDHDGLVYAPIREFAEAAGFKVMIDTAANTVSITK
jgi:hypothetical protein